MDTKDPRPPIRLGIDFGSTLCRAAYVHPGPEKVVVPVPLVGDPFRSCFPIAERLVSNEMYAARFFPGLIQRLNPDFSLNLHGRICRSREVVEDLIKRIVEDSQRFAGSPVESVLLCHPIAISADACDGLRQALDATSRPAALGSDAEAACAFSRAAKMTADEHSTVLVFSAGYTGFGAATARITPRGVRVLGKVGEQGILAGNMIDFAILQSAMFRLKDARITPGDANPSAWGMLQHAIETAKHSLLDGDAVQFTFPEPLTPTHGRPARFSIAGRAFRQLIDEHLDHALRLVDGLLEETGVKSEELSYALLLGGTSHLPQVIRRLQDRFGKANLLHLPTDAVASGAALLAADQTPEELNRNATTQAGDATFVPTLIEHPGLVTLVASEDQHAATTLPRPTAAAEFGGNSRSLDTMTLEWIRARVEAGEVTSALEYLTLLRGAIDNELDKLRRQVN